VKPLTAVKLKSALKHIIKGNIQHIHSIGRWSALGWLLSDIKSFWFLTRWLTAVGIL